MSFRPRFKHCFRFEIVPSVGVILLSERGYFLLRGAIYLLLAPLLDGQRTIDEIIECLQGQVSAAEVIRAIKLLQHKEYVVDTNPSLPSEQAAFWELLSIDPQDAATRLQETTISIVSFGALNPSPFQTIIASLGIQVGSGGKFWVALTNDYLHDGLNAVNQESLTYGRPWLLVKPVGSELWIGPLFLPGKTGCWACLAHRLQGARKVENFLQEKKKMSPPFSFPPAALPSTLQTAYSIAATEIVKWIVRGKNEEIEGQVVTLNMVSLTKQCHRLVRRPQCPHCGDPVVFAAKQAEPLVLQSRKKVFTTDAGHRSLSPEDTVKKLEHHISPITGIVSFLRSNASGEDKKTSSYIAGHNFVQVSGAGSSDLDFLRASLQGVSGGTGQKHLQAKASALCEAIEHYSGVFQGDESRFRARLKDLGATAFHPNACMLFSEQQFKNREQWNVRVSWVTWVPKPFDVAMEIEWSPVWSLTYSEPRYVPTACCYYEYSRKHNAWFALADSNGCAAGHSKEEAISQGFMELVERDSVALWWYNRLQKPTVDLSSFAEPYFQELQAYYKMLHRDLWVLDITSDFGIPTFAAISRRNDQDVEDIILGFGADFDPRIAILRSLAEVNQSLPAVFLGTPEKGKVDLDEGKISWWRTATLENQPYLAPVATTAPKVQENYPDRRSDDFHVDVMTCIKIAKEKGLEVLVLDQTRPDTGLHVVKVFIPGLRHFWARFGPGRLYEVPVQMGWLTKPLTEDQLNPLPLYI